MVASYELRKYGNRRIYDPSTSSYITLQQVSELVRAGHIIHVIDHQTGEDLTHATLLQVVMEFEQINPLLSTNILRQMIMSYGNQMQATFADFLSESMTTFVNQQQQLHDQLNQAMEKGMSQTDWFSSMGQSWWEFWQNSFSSVFLPQENNIEKPIQTQKKETKE